MGPEVRRRRGIDRASSLDKPLLGDYDGNDDDGTLSPGPENRAWHMSFAVLVSKWAEWLVTLVSETGAALISGLEAAATTLLPIRTAAITAPPPPKLTPLQEERLQKLHARVAVPYDGSREDHKAALQTLWELAYPLRPFPGFVSEEWKDMGWQGTNPSTDFRGGGFISLENLIYFGKKYPRSFQQLLNKEEGTRSTWEYPFAVGGLNVTFMLLQLLDLRAGIPGTSAGRHFLEVLEEEESAFDELFCLAFEMLDVQWLAMRASYMEFNDVVKVTRAQLEKALTIGKLRRIEDIPESHLLRR